LQELYEVEGWAERYRSRNEGTFPGTGPAIHDGVTFFTDNTFPVQLFAHSYNLFRKPLYAEQPEVTNATALTKVAINQPGKAGFMFWSVVVSPLEGNVIVWDSAGRSVQARDASDLSLKWNISAYQGDCITLAADRGHVYMSDYSNGPEDYSTWMYANGPNSNSTYPNLQKYFIVADASTGGILLNMTIMSGQGMKPALIVPGAHNDVIVAKPNGLNRLYIDV
jgi:hypothetical protein